MIAALTRYARWLHLQWPGGRVEPLPACGEDGATRDPRIRIAGDLTGIPLLKFALETGVRAMRAFAADPALRRGAAPENAVDVTIVGGGVAGFAAALEARRLGLSIVVIEAAEPFATIANFPVRKPIFTYPRAKHVDGPLQVTADVKEALLDELRAQADAAGIAPRAARVERVESRGTFVRVHCAGGETLAARAALVAIGRSGDFRRLGVPGESAPDRVFHRLHDPADFAGRRVLVVGGGDSAVETAVALADAGARVTLVHRGESLVRPRPANLERLAARRERIDVRLATRVVAIGERDARLAGADGRESSLACDAIFTMLGRAAPLDFFRRSRLPLRDERTPGFWFGFAAFVLFCAWLYDWKSGGAFSNLWYARHWFPTDFADRLAAAGGAVAAAARDRKTLLGTLAISGSSPSFWYTVAYSIVVAVFGWRRIALRKTPYVTVQTLTLVAIQIVPLFLLPEIVLPLLDANGLLPRAFADALFPVVSYGHGREFWRAYGFVLAWPLDVYNVFTARPLPWWLAIGFVQTFVLIPLLVWRWGKGAYCGWICSCGALAETLGDRQRAKMPHGPGWNRLNLAGQGVLAIAVFLLLVRIAGWVLPSGNVAARLFDAVLAEKYKWTIDVFLAGVVGYGAYFWFSGRVWCRFFCPLAALMHVYARVSRFRIFADKKKCISCNVCTSVCHQGIDVMSFAQRGAPMEDPECVRCSACVEQCPTGVLAFGRYDSRGFVRLDALEASPVRMRERE